MEGNEPKTKKANPAKGGHCNVSKQDEAVGGSAKGRTLRSRKDDVDYREISTDSETEQGVESDGSDYWTKPSTRTSSHKPQKRKKTSSTKSSCSKRPKRSVADVTKKCIRSKAPTNTIALSGMNDKRVPLVITIKKVTSNEVLKNPDSEKDNATDVQPSNLNAVVKKELLDGKKASPFLTSPKQGTGAYVTVLENGEWVKKWKANVSAAAGIAPDEDDTTDQVNAEVENLTNNEKKLDAKIVEFSKNEELECTNAFKKLINLRAKAKQRRIIAKYHQKMYKKICGICGIVTTSYQSTVEHNKSMHDIMYYTCWAEECNKKELTHEDILRHFRLVHKYTDIPCPFTCSEREFSKKCKIWQHMRTCHAAEMGYISSVPKPGQFAKAMKGEYVMEKLNQIGISNHFKLLKNSHYICAFDERIKMARWTMEVLVSAETTNGRTNHQWKLDHRIDLSKQLTLPGIQSLFGYVLGHLAAAGNHFQTAEETEDTYLLTNVMPMHTKVNIGAWKSLEVHARKLALCGWNQVTVISGPILDKSAPGIVVPGSYSMFKPPSMFKVLLLEHENYPPLVQAFVVPNEEVGQSVWNFRTDLNHVKEKTGISFLTNTKHLTSWGDDALKMAIKCESCKKCFYTEELLEQHINETHLNKFKCGSCMKTFDDQELLDAHKLEKHSNLICPYVGCNVTFHIPAVQRAHIAIHRNIRAWKCMTCNKRFNRQDTLNGHKRIHLNIKPFECKICLEKFTRKSNLKDHMTTHTGEKQFVCEVCGSSFRKRYGLNRHMALHSDDKLFLCEFCGRTFNFKNNLTDHVKRMHKEESIPIRKRHVCEICGYSTNETTGLRAHMRVHSGEKPFVCKICGRGFAQNSNLTGHMKCHANGKWYKCELCGFSTTRSNEIIGHRKTHTAANVYECDICSYTTVMKCNLKQHMKKHSNEKPFKCEICNQAYKFKGSLKNHMQEKHNQLEA